MHSNREDDLNLVLEASAYLGLMNSAISPLDYANTTEYSGNENNRQLVLPGYLEYPFTSTGSPPTVFIKGSNWLYSTLIVIDDPSLFVNWHIPPTASPGFLGTVIVFNSNPLCLLTPSTDGNALNARGLVSYIMNNHFLPSSFHFYANPDMNSSVWISPCPCGLVSNNSFPGILVNLASLSIIAGTFSYLMRCTWDLLSPK